MANQWYYNKDGQQQGPVSDSQLRKLTETGELTKETLIWKEGMTDWKKAVALRGLFPNSDSATPPPIPSSVVDAEVTDTPNSQPTPQTTLSFGESAKLTGNLAAKQTELTKINQVSIPAQHVKIGQHVYDSKHEQSQHAELFAEIDRLNNSIREVEEATKSQPQPNSISERAKSLASQTANAAKLKTYQMQRRLKLIALGKAIFESGKTPEACSQQRTEIETLLSRAGTLTEEITDIKGKLAEQGRGAAQAGRSLLSNTAIVVASSIFCAPVGLLLIWKHPKWDKQTKLKWAGVSMACLIGFAIFAQIQGSAANKELASADQLWNGKETADAIAKYRELTQNTFLSDSDKARVFRRVIEFDCENDNLESAKELIKRANSSGLELTLTNAKAKSLVSELRPPAPSPSVSANLPSGTKSSSDTGKPLTDDERLKTIALMTYGVIAEKKQWKDAPPDFVDGLMKQSANELVKIGQKDFQKYAKSISSKTTNRVVNGTDTRIVEYGSRAKFIFVQNPEIRRFVLFALETDEKMYSIVGVENK